MECKEPVLRELLHSVWSENTARMIMETVGAGHRIIIEMEDGTTQTLHDEPSALRVLQAQFGWSPAAL